MEVKAPTTKELTFSASILNFKNNFVSKSVSTAQIMVTNSLFSCIGIVKVTKRT